MINRMTSVKFGFLGLKKNSKIFTAKGKRAQLKEVFKKYEQRKLDKSELFISMQQGYSIGIETDHTKESEADP